MRFRPCIDLHDGVVKQIVGGSLIDGSTPVTNFVASSPAADFARMYAKAGLPGGHIIMLGPASVNSPSALAALAAYPGGMQIGGGITPVNAGEYLRAGASHVIVTSYVFRDGAVDWARLAEMEAAVGGKERLVLDLSCRRRRRNPAGHTHGAPDGTTSGAADGADAGDSEYVVVTDRWQKWTDVVVDAASLARLAAHCAEFLVHGVDSEGLRAGVEEDLVRLLGAHSPIPVTYAGGVRDMADVARVRALGGGRVDVSVGSALDIFGGSLPFEELVRWQAAQAT